MTIKHLILSGGGVRGIAVCGVLKHLHPKLQNLESILGVSVGSIIGFVYAIGYTPEEIEEIVLKKKFSSLINISLLSLLGKYGLDDGEKILNWLKEYARKKDISDDITFIELYKKTGINFRVGVTNLTESQQEILDCRSWPNLSVYKAIKMSFSIPFVFSSVKFNNCVYVDGAITDNYPIEVYNDMMSETIGIQLVSRKKRCETDTFLSFVSSVMKCLKVQLEDKILDNRTLCIPAGEVTSMSFDITKDQKIAMIKEAYEMAEKWKFDST